MKFNLSATGIGLAVTFLIIFFGSTMFVEGQTEAGRTSNNASDSKCAEESVIKILSDVDLAKASPQQVVEAMGCLSTQKKLGDKISNAAIPPLIDLLAFEPPSKNSPDEAASAPIRPRPFSSSYPAIETLFIIGKQSLPYLVEAIAVNSTTSLKGQNALTTVLLIVRDDPIEGINFLEVSKENYSELTKKSRIENAVGKVKTFYHIH